MFRDNGMTSNQYGKH